MLEMLFNDTNKLKFYATNCNGQINNGEIIEK